MNIKINKTSPLFYQNKKKNGNLFMKKQWKLLNSQNKFSDRLFNIRHDRYHFSKSGQEKDYTVIETNNWVNIVPITSKGDVILIKQYRHGTGEIVIEVPGGVVEKNDPSPEFAGERELLEETGYKGDKLINLGTVIPNPAIQNNRCHIFLAENVRKISEQNLDPQESIEIFSLPKDEVYKMIYEGKINHSLVIDAFCLLMLYEKYKA